MNLELFPCSGGVALGFRRAGIEFDLAIDADPDACASYEANLGHRPVQMDARDFLRLVRDGGWRPKTRIDFFAADPPCTPWSRAGKRLGQDDERDMLGVTVELIDLLRPVAWVIANVPGLDDADQWEAVVKPVIGGMAMRAGYCVDYASMDAADYGVPQHRVRPFWFGHPVGTPCIRWPAPTHADPATLVTLPLPGIAALEPWVTLLRPNALAPHGAVALAHLSEAEIGRRVRLRCKGDAPAATIVAGGTTLGGGPASTVLIDRSRSRQNGKEQGSRSDAPGRVVGADSRMHGNLLVQTDGHPMALADSVAPTIRSGGDGHSAPHTVLVNSYMSEGWVLSERARAIIQGFPDGPASLTCERCGQPLSGLNDHPVRWHFCAKTATSRSSMLGQAMPPPFAEAVARSIGGWPVREPEAAMMGINYVGGKP